MNRTKKYIKIIINIATMIALIAFCIWILPKCISFLMPFIIAMIVAMIADPIVKFLEKRLKIKRKAGSVFVIILVLAIVGGIMYAFIAKLIQELFGFIRIAPELWMKTVNALEKISSGGRTNIVSRILPDYRSTIQYLEEAIGDAITTGIEKSFSGISAETGTVSIAKSIPNALIAIITTILASYMFVADSEYIPELFKKFVPESISDRWKIVTNSIKSAVGGYFSAQLKIMVFVYVVLLVGFLILRVPYAALIALLIAVLDFLPFFGTGAAMIPWAIVAIFNGDYKMAVGLIVTWALSQLIRQVVQPKFLSDSMGLPPIPTLFLLYLGYNVAGALGLIFAVPVGMLVFNLYKAGVFSNFIWSIKILLKDFTKARRFTDEDLKNEGMK